MAHRLLLDVSSMTYRAYFAMREPGVFAKDGTPVGAVHGYLDMVTKLIVDRRPDEVVHVYDHDWRPVARTDIYAGYKAGRPEEPEDLTKQFALLRETLDRTGMLQAQTENWEAEDAIGAFCLEATDTDRIEIVSGDRDLIQLVRDPVVTLLFTLRGVSELAIYDEAGVLEKFGVPASRYVEYAILRGDPSDGLPGVKGVGEKTARELVTTYPSLEAMLAAAADGDRAIKPALRAKLLESADYIASMQRLVPIHTDSPLSLWAGERDDEGLLADAPELGLKGPIQRLLAALSSANAV
jgi:5'-3' exonuclease